MRNVQIPFPFNGITWWANRAGDDHADQLGGHLYARWASAKQGAPAGQPDSTMQGVELIVVTNDANPRRGLQDINGNPFDPAVENSWVRIMKQHKALGGSVTVIVFETARPNRYTPGHQDSLVDDGVINGVTIQEKVRDFVKHQPPGPVAGGPGDPSPSPPG